MPVFRYEATDSSGIPVHGTADAADDAELNAALERRGLRLVSCTLLSLDALISNQRRTLPRLYQLRVGEQLREALLSGLPAHEAVRAIVAEPLVHPLLSVAPWLQGMSVLAFLVAVMCWKVSGSMFAAVQATAIVMLVVVPVIWMVLRRHYLLVPRRLLRRLADRLEAGESLSSEADGVMPDEMRSVMRADIDDAGKARIAADLVPCLLGSSLRTQQFVMATVGPLFLLGVVLVVLYAGMLFIVPQFTDIFEGFGVELPAITLMIVDLGRVVSFFGIAGWVTLIAAGCGILILISKALTTGWTMELLARIPVFGMAFRWAMQAKVARMLAAAVRNGASYAESVRVATAGSGFRSVQSVGQSMAMELETGSGQIIHSRLLSGLPMSMLYVTSSDTSDEERRSAIAQTFQRLSEMLESATVGQGRLFAVLVQFLTVSLAGFCVAVGVFAMFLPLIKLLNDLS
ncbi:MAG: hypothetical protein R3C59_26445 [Planctomycetaceae bacterium]